MSIYLDGSVNGFVNCGNNQNKILSINTPFTAVFWLLQQKGGPSTQRLISRSPGVSNGMMIGTADNQTLTFFCFYSTTSMNVSTAAGTYKTDRWNSIAFVQDGGDIGRDLQVYLNLSIRAITSATSGIGNRLDNGGSDLNIGRTGNGSNFVGLMAYVQIFNVMLSFLEITKATFYPGSIQRGLVGYWPLYGESNPEPDYSGNNNHGVLGSTTAKGYSDPPVNGIFLPRARRFPYTIPPVITIVTFDSASSSGYEPALNTYSWSHTVGSNSNRILVVGVGIFGVGQVSSVKYNGVDLTFLRSDVTGIYRSELWYIVGPPVGTFTVQVTLNTSLTSIANAQSYYNVDQVNPIDAQNGAVGTNTPASASVTPVADKDMVVGNLVAQTASGVTSAGGQNSRTTNNGALGTDDSDDKGIVTPAAPTTLTWNGLGALDAWAVSLVALKQLVADQSTSIIIPPKRKLKTILSVGL